MDCKNEWIIELADDDNFWSNNLFGEDSIWPAPIVFNYKRLREMMHEGNVYGSILQIKDLYEIVLKISVIMSLIYLDQKFENELLDKTDIIDILMKKRFALGDWAEVAGRIIRYSDFNPPRKTRKERKKKKAYSLPEGLANYVYYSEELIGEGVGKYVNVIEWRNDTIGHGIIRFEDDENHKAEIIILTKKIKEFFDSNVNDVFHKIYFSYDDEKFIGDSKPIDEFKSISLTVETDKIEVYRYSIKLFFLDSFRNDKGEVKYLDYFSGKENITSIDLFFDYLDKYDSHERKEDEGVKKSRVFDSEEKMYRFLYSPDKYKVPKGLEEELQDFVFGEEKGVATLCMDRGTGKTAFSYSVDGLYGQAGEKIFPRTIVRAYSIGNTITRGINYFFGYINYVFTKTKTDSSRGSEEKAPEISVYDENPKKAMADLLNYYRAFYESRFYIDTLVLIIDGIDELTEESSVVNKWLIDSRDANLLDEGVFIIYTSRFEDECTNSRFSQMMIKEKVMNSDKLIEIRRDSEINKQLLSEYIKGRNQKMKADDIEVLISRADYRFLYLKVFIYKNETIIPDTVQEVIRIYLDSLFERYNEKQKNIALNLLACFSIYGRISIQDYIKFFSGEELTYRFIGIVNDLQPLLTCLVNDDGRQFELSNEEYKKYIIDNYRDETIELSQRTQEIVVNVCNEWEKYGDDALKYSFICRAAESIKILKSEYDIKVDREFIVSCIDVERDLVYKAQTNIYYDNLYKRLLECFYLFIPELPGCSFGKENDYYRIPNLFLSESFLGTLYCHDAIKFKEMIDLMIKKTQTGINQWNLLLDKDVSIESVGIDYLDYISSVYQIYSKRIVNEDHFDFVMEKLYPDPDMMNQITYYHFLVSLLNQNLDRKQREQVLNTLAFSCMVKWTTNSVEKSGLVKNSSYFFELLEKEGLEIKTPSNSKMWINYYNDIFHPNSSKDNADEAYAFHLQYINDNNKDRFGTMNSLSNDDLIDYDIRNINSTNEYERKIAIKISLLYFERIDEILNNDSEMSNSIISKFYWLISSNVIDYIYNNTIEKLIFWIDKFKKYSYSDLEMPNLYILRELYYQLIKRMGEEGAIKYYEEFVYSIDGMQTVLVLLQTHSTSEEWTTQNKGYGKVLCSDNSINLLKYYAESDNEKKLIELCRDILRDDDEFFSSLFSDNNLYSILEYQNYRLLFWLVCERLGIIDTIKGKFTARFSQIVELLLEEISDIKKDSNHSYYIEIMDRFFYILFKYRYYNRKESFDCIEKIKTKLMEIKNVSDEWVRSVIVDLEMYVDSAEILFKFLSGQNYVVSDNLKYTIDILDNKYTVGYFKMNQFFEMLDNGEMNKENYYIKHQYHPTSIRGFINKKPLE